MNPLTQNITKPISLVAKSNYRKRTTNEISVKCFLQVNFELTVAAMRGVVPKAFRQILARAPYLNETGIK